MISLRRLVAAMAAGLILLVPATAGANKVTFKKARAVAEAAAEEVAMDSDGDRWGAGKCQRVSKHKVWCRSWVRSYHEGEGDSEGSWSGCSWRTFTVRSHKTGKYRSYTRPKSLDHCYV